MEESLAAVAAAVGDVPALVGTVESNPSGTGRSFFNSAAFCHRGRVVSFARKCLLPTYDVFDEDRYFEPAAQPTVITHAGTRIGVTICEDIWTHPMISTRRLYNGMDPVRQLASQRCDLMVNLSASPWNHGKSGVRQTLVTDAARALGCPVAYVNAVGGNDELIFDGRSLVSDPAGRVLTGMAAFAEDLAVAETGRGPWPGGAFADLRAAGDGRHPRGSHARPPGLRAEGRLPKRPCRAFRGDRLGGRRLDSGGRVRAAERDRGFPAVGDLVPAFAGRREAACREPGDPPETIGIADVVAACEGALAPLFSGRPRDVTEENIQARVRGVLMMALSNKFGALLLTTGNKSEMAVGYCTLYGDMCGGLAVISDVYKTQVYALANWINADARRAGRTPADTPVEH